jgi:phospholipid N-methyltransferase
MPTVEWLKREFHYGYQSGNVLDATPSERRVSEEQKIGGSYKRFFEEAIVPLLRPDSHVLELGPGGGDWTRALLRYLPEGEVHTCDFQDVAQWLKPETYNGRLHCRQVTDNDFSHLQDGYFDLFFSFGVLVHCDMELIAEILRNALPKMKPGGYALHNHGDWEKLARWGWDKGAIPQHFKNLPDAQIWWPRNTGGNMTRLATATGWRLMKQDINYFKRDGVILLQRPELS